jgi:hypothetical protein
MSSPPTEAVLWVRFAHRRLRLTKGHESQSLRSPTFRGAEFRKAEPSACCERSEAIKRFVKHANIFRRIKNIVATECSDYKCKKKKGNKSDCHPPLFVPCARLFVSTPTTKRLMALCSSMLLLNGSLDESNAQSILHLIEACL